MSRSLRQEQEARLRWTNEVVDVNWVDYLDEIEPGMSLLMKVHLFLIQASISGLHDTARPRVF